nr:hypothetical protein [Kibdelosporangium sp. MJ126-NF4]
MVRRTELVQITEHSGNSASGAPIGRSRRRGCPLGRYPANARVLGRHRPILTRLARA